MRAGPIARCHRPARPGDPVFQRRQCLSREAAAYWMPRSSRGMDSGGDVTQHSRGTKCPSFAYCLPSKEEEGAGNAGCRYAPAGLRANDRKHARKSSQVRRTVRHSLRDGLRLTPRSPRCPGFDSHRRARENVSRALDLGIGRPGPHGFAVRAGPRSSHASLRVHRIPASRFVTNGRNVPL
jgi:hypothetical protein